MNATAVNAEKLRELDEDTRRAWEEYSERLRELAGQEYHDAETRSWDELQEQLELVEIRRQQLCRTGG